MRVVFMGSPDFAVPSLHTLNDHYNVVAVVTQPDRKAGRGKKLTRCAVKTAAELLDLPILQPARLRHPNAVDELAALNPDLIVVAAYGQILPPAVLDLPQHGCINVHASLLPRWRGASPIHAAIREGDTETGITIMKMDEGLDTGPILLQASIPIPVETTGGKLSNSLAALGAQALLQALPPYLKGELRPRPQEGEATYARLLKKADGQLDFTREAEQLVRQIRAYDPWPGSFFFLNERRIAVIAARASTCKHVEPGQTAVIDGLPSVGTGNGCLLLETLQPAGKKPLPGEVFLRGARDFPGQLAVSP